MRRKALAFLLTVSLCAGLFPGCKPSGIDDIVIDKTISGETVEYTLFAHDLNVYGEDNRVFQQLEEKFNIKLKMNGAPFSNWMEKLCLLINADDPPDLFNFIPNDYTYSSSYYNFVNNQMVLPLSDLISEEDTPNLVKLFNCDLYKDLKVNGKYYFVPNPTYATNHVMYVRKDWLNNLGLSAPTTLDEYTAMLQALTENDPDKNGKKDTYGLSASKVFEWMNNFKPTFGVSPGWSKGSDGKWVLDAFTDEYKSFLTWMKDLYSKGYLKPEFYLYDDSEAENDFINGKAGCLISNGDAKVGGMVSKMAKVDPKAEIDVLPMPDGAGKGGYVGTGCWWGGWSISYRAKEPMRLAKLLDYLHSEEGQLLRLCGIRDIHYTVDETGEITPNYEEREKEGDKSFPADDDGKRRGYFSFGAYFGNLYEISGSEIKMNAVKSTYAFPELTDRAWEMTNKNIVYQYPATGMELPSEFSQISTKVTDKVTTYSVRIIAGNIGFEEGLKKMREESVTAGYDSAVKLLEENAK